MVVSVGIDVAKDKHDCFILNSEGAVLADVFTVPNNMDGFNRLLQTIRDCTVPKDKIKVGLEATGHYSYNILACLCRSLTFHLPIRTTQELLSAHGEAWLSLSSLCHFQRHQVCLLVGSHLCCLSRQETGGRQALQCCDFPRGQETGAAYLCFREVRASLPSGCVVYS